MLRFKGVKIFDSTKKCEQYMGFDKSYINIPHKAQMWAFFFKKMVLSGCAVLLLWLCMSICNVPIWLTLTWQAEPWLCWELVFSAACKSFLLQRTTASRPNVCSEAFGTAFLRDRCFDNTLLMIRRRMLTESSLSEQVGGRWLKSRVKYLNVVVSLGKFFGQSLD